MFQFCHPDFNNIYYVDLLSDHFSGCLLLVYWFVVLLFVVLLFVVLLIADDVVCVTLTVSFMRCVFSASMCVCVSCPLCTS